MVVGIVSISALLVRASFHVDELRARITEATHVQQDLLQDVAALSSPSRIHRWAREQGFVVPDGVVILSVPGARA
jgi:cell division protein FtsL